MRRCTEAIETRPEILCSSFKTLIRAHEHVVKMAQTTIYYPTTACFGEGSRRGHVRNHSQRIRGKSFPPPTRHWMARKNGDRGDVTYVTVRAGTPCNTAIHRRGIPRRCSCSVQLPFSYTSVVIQQMHVKGRPIISLSCQTWTVLKYCLGITTTCGTHQTQHNTSVSTI